MSNIKFNYQRHLIKTKTKTFAIYMANYVLSGFKYTKNKLKF